MKQFVLLYFCTTLVVGCGQGDTGLAKIESVSAGDETIGTNGALVCKLGSTDISLNPDTTSHGLGLVISVSSEVEGVLVRRIQDGWPADNAGVKTGDVITVVNGKSTRDMSLLDAVKALRGRADSVATILVERATSPGPLTFEIDRQRLEIQQEADGVGERNSAP